MSDQPYIPRKTPMVGTGAIVSAEWDRSFLQPVLAALNALTAALVLQGSFADPNGHVVASPGALYTVAAGGAGVTLWVKESGSQTNTGWIAK